MEIDWMSRGMMMYRLTRGCSDRKVDDPEPPCKQGSTSLAQFKDCDVVCNEPGCNSGIDQVADRFDAGADAVQECYSCEYTEGKDGSVSGAPFCGASMWVITISSYTENKLVVPIKRKEISVFQQEHVQDTQTVLVSKLRHFMKTTLTRVSTLRKTTEDALLSITLTEMTSLVRQLLLIRSVISTANVSRPVDYLKWLFSNSATCNENNCNTRGLTAGNTCYSCKVTYDTMYRPIGVGDVDCWFNVK